MSTLLGRQGELLAQLREQLQIILPSTSSPPANNKLVEPAVGPPTGAAGPGPPPPPAAVAPSSMPRRLGRSSKRGRDDDEHHGEDPAAAAARRPRRHYCKRRKKKQQSGTSMVVTSAPDLFDGYQWRKYGQKQIEGAMYPRSYYRCTRSAEQGCAAKRTVQRNDDDGAGAAAVSRYTVVRMGEHTCTANDSPEAPVILEATVAAGVVVLRPDTASTISNRTTPASSAAASCSTTTTTATGSTITSSIVSDGYNGGLFAAVNDNNDWVPARAASSSPSSLVPTIEDFAAGPIRSPVYISAADGWTIDLDQQFLLQLVNEPS